MDKKALEAEGYKSKKIKSGKRSSTVFYKPSSKGGFDVVWSNGRKGHVSGADGLGKR